jgi:hypothetical protein
MISTRSLAVLLLLTEIVEPLLEVFLRLGPGLRRNGRISPSEGTPGNGKAGYTGYASQQDEPSQDSRRPLGWTHLDWLRESRSRGTRRAASNVIGISSGPTKGKAEQAPNPFTAPQKTSTSPAALSRNLLTTRDFAIKAAFAEIPGSWATSEAGWPSWTWRSKARLDAVWISSQIDLSRVLVSCSSWCRGSEPVLRKKL